VTRAGRWLLHLLERFISRYHEGPRAPRRLRDEVLMFRRYRPDATADEWEAFAVALAEGSYEQGFARGYEWLERDWPGPATEPELLAEQAQHDWSVTDLMPDFWSAPAGGGMTVREAAEVEHALERGGVRVVREVRR